MISTVFEKELKEYKTKLENKKNKQKEYCKRHYEKGDNKKKIAERAKMWNRNNPEKIKELSKSYYERNREKIIAKQRAKSGKQVDDSNRISTKR